MKRLLFLFLVGFPFIMSGQSVLDSTSALFRKQMIAFPQEKIYIHTDKPYYISGEKIWFRAHLVDAVSHLPALMSRYVYVELINPMDIVIERIKIRQEEGAYYGNISLADDLPEGNYTLRAYTYFMRNLDENYFFTKNIFIGDPQSRLIDIQTRFDLGKKVRAEIQVKEVSSINPVVIDSVKMQINNGKQMTLKTDKNGIANVTFDVPPEAKQRTMLVTVVRDNGVYKKYLSIPFSNDDFDISFFPEGGQMIYGSMSRLAFKALRPDGNPEDVTGIIYDQDGKNVSDMATDRLGAGLFTLQPEKGKIYHAICKNSNGVSKRFELPSPLESGYALGCNPVKDNLYVMLRKPDVQVFQDTLYLLAHTRGSVHYAEPWNFSKEFVVFKTKSFPSGVLHLLLLDKKLHPISERLVFVNNDDQAVVHYQTDKDNYADRSLIQSTITFTDYDENPLAGSFSVSVTDDNEVITDSTSNIMVNLLLTSDLRGTIEDPGFYFRKDPSSANALDLLMLTQGWRRYDISRIMNNNIVYPEFPMEIGPEISGTVKNVLSGKPAEGVEVSVLSLNNEKSCYDYTVTNKEGRFTLNNCEFRDSVRYLVQTDRRIKAKRFEISVDKETFPEKTLQSPPREKEISRKVFDKYATKAEDMYVLENGMRSMFIKEVEIIARKPLHKSPYYQWPDYTLTREEIDKMPSSVKNDIGTLLRFVPGLNGLAISGAMGPPLIVIDNETYEYQTDILGLIDPRNISQVDVLRPGNANVFGPDGKNGAVMIFTRHGTFASVKKNFNIKEAFPLGYQSPVEFYAPKYDTPVARVAPESDLRTTIHWQPNVQTDSIGVASFNFYTADAQTTYTVIMEGITNDGKIIRKEHKILRNAK